MITYIPFRELNAMPADKAKMIRQFAHVNDGNGLHIPTADLKNIDAGMLSTPQMELNEALSECESPLLGTRLETVFRKWGVDKVAKAWERWTGLGCGCKNRKEKLDRIDAAFRAVKERIVGGG